MTTTDQINELRPSFGAAISPRKGAAAEAELAALIAQAQAEEEQFESDIGAFCADPE